MNTNTSEHEPKARPAAAVARLAKRRRHPGPIELPEVAPGDDQAAPPADRATAGYTFRTWNQLHRRNRRIHFAIAIAVSVAAHVGLIVMPEDTVKVAVASAEPAKAVEVIVFDIPEPEETPVEIEDSEPADTPVAEFAPPMQADLPSIVSVDSFVQPMQPPVASSLDTDLGMLVVPTHVPIGQGANTPKLFEISELDRVPNLIRSGTLNYPPEFLRSRTEGYVVLLVVVDPNGRVKVSRVLQSTHPEFSRAATHAAESSLYEKPRKGGVAVSASYTLKVSFSLPPGA